MKKRFLAALLALCMVFALGTVSALADDPVAKIGDTTYNDLSTAFNAVQNGQTIVLLKDVTLMSDISVRQGESGRVTYTLDLGSHTLTSKDDTTALRLYNSNIIITNGTIDLNDTVADANTCAIWCYNDVNLTIADSATINADGDSYCIGVRNGAENVTVNVNGALTGGCGLTINGLIKSDNNINIVINGKIDVSYLGLYLAGVGETTVNRSAYIKGDTGIEIRAGELTVNGGTIVGGDNYTAAANSNGSTVSGAGIAVSQHTTNQNIDVTINGGNISGAVALAQEELQSENNAEQVDISVSGGNFKATDAEYDAIETHSKKTVTVTGGKFLKSDNSKSDVDEYLAQGLDIDEGGEVVVGPDAVAKVGDTVYTDLQKAIDAAQSGTTKTVTLLKDVPLNTGLTISENITIDGRDYDLTISGVTGNGIEITSGHTLTLANTDLKITGKTSTAGKFDGTGIYAVGNLTLRNSNVVLEDLNKAIIANAGKNAIKLEDSTLTIDDIDGNASNGGKWTVDDSTVNISNVGNYGLSVYSLKTTGASKLSFENIGYGAIFAELSIDIGGTTSVKIDNAGFNHEKNTIIRESTYGDCYAPIQLVVDKSGLPTIGREITFGSGTSISVVDSFDHNGDVYVDKGTEYVNNSGDYLSVKIVGDGVFMVTFVDDDDDFLFSYTVDENEDITLPGRPYYSAREFIGWLCDEDHKIYEAGDKYKDVDEDLEFKAVWETAAYDIVIDDDILHGDIWTSPRSEAEAGDTVHVYADPDAGYVLEDLSVTYRSGRYELKLTRVSANHYTFTMPAYDVYVTAEFTSDGFPFDDVRSNQWFYDAVYYVWANDLMEGVDYDEFNPNGTMTRAMFWAVLGRIDGETITGSDWADEARDWAMSEGVSDGTNPNGLVTREQMVTMLWRYAGERDGSGNLSRYTDGDKVAQYATEAMRWALGNGIIEGTTATTLEPQATATRAQCAAIFMRYYK